MSTLVIEGFHRTDDRGRMVSFNEGIHDPAALDKYLRTEQHVFGSPDAEPVVLLLGTDGLGDGQYIGTVAVQGDNNARIASIEQAIVCLEMVRDGLREAGHQDHERTATQGRLQ